MYHYAATVIKVIDADTVDVQVDLGFHIRFDIRTRLLGINAPELNTPEGKAARDWLRTRLPVGSALVVSTFKDPMDKYGRWLALLEIGGVNVNDELVSLGLAAPYLTA